ncbi:biotin--[acetyl-CoA-carboxylase] ligase [Segetibacter sp. 3557_3]|uniref:biotin--[acetyl-CoA-carboxylase] ligase n=1 Tax=Segetibacter sp. 3557_3 TaxID=2547429 RepID=UPI001058752B|nr:biotin--[acetyl-CoA-carboxylase] ligase [Segetibacter sp. 3557_3]TDH24083.1 biotin--[acetyl-CoA-carboxylase] ligase [Segetibacter sp. 3557_3]
MRALNPIGEPFIELSEVGSTNNYAMERVQAQMAEHGSTWFANHQTAGKGQRGKSWITAPGENITMSIVLDCTGLPIHRQFDLHAVIAVAGRKFLEAYAGDDTRIKWPNDLYWKDRKAGGILIENVVRGNHWKFAVVGIGINVNQTQFKDGVLRPVSLRQITGKSYKTVSLARELCTVINKLWTTFRADGIREIFREYNTHLFKRGSIVKLKKDNTTFAALIDGVDEFGNLVVDSGNQTFEFGSLQWIIE